MTGWKEIENAKKRIEEIRSEFARECEIIADMCEEEGYPSHGSNYHLRVESSWDSNYKDEWDELWELIPDEEE